MTTSTKLNWILGVAVFALLFSLGWLVGSLMRVKSDLRDCNAEIQLLQDFRIDTVFYKDTVIHRVTKYKPGATVIRWRVDSVDVPMWLNLDSLYYTAMDSVRNDSVDIWWRAGIFGYLSTMDVSYRLKQPKIVYEYIPVNVLPKDRTEWGVWASASWQTLQAGVDVTMPNNSGVIVGYDFRGKSPVIGIRYRLGKPYTFK